MTDHIATAPADGEAVRELLRNAHSLAEPIEVRQFDPDLPAAIYQLVPQGYGVQKIDLSEYQGRPARKTGHVALADAASFIRYVQRHAFFGATLYCNQQSGTVKAVLNDHDADAAGWADHTATLHLTKTPEWVKWSQASGVWFNSQIGFAEFVEDHLHVFESPSGTHMLELAQTFEATTSVDFASGARLDNGQRQLLYKETVGARAGQAGQLEVPAKVRIGLIPFKGGPGFKLDAFLRYRIESGGLRLMFKLDRPDEVLEAAFEQTVEAIENELDVPELMLVHTAH